MGKHQAPQNLWDWFVSCFGGISPSCSSKCEVSLVDCMQGTDTSKTDKFHTCLTSTLVQSGVCQVGCTPSYKMLVLGETPVLNLTHGSKWGEAAVPQPKPSTSICTAPHGPTPPTPTPSPKPPAPPAPS